MSNARTLVPAVVESAEAVEVEVLSEAEHRREIDQRAALEQQQIIQEILKQDQFARDRAYRLLKRCRGGSIPNLLQDEGLAHFDAILASKVVVQLLQLGFMVHGRQRDPEQVSVYARPNHLRMILSCGDALFELGGISLMERVIEQWIPALDRSALRQAWRSIGL